MPKTYKSGTGTSSSRTSPLAPTSTNVSMPAGVYRGPAPVERGTLRRKGNVQAGSPGGGKANRAQVYERHGAQHRITVPLYPARAPEAAHTQANGRIIRSFPKLQDTWSGGNFWDASRGM